MKKAILVIYISILALTACTPSTNDEKKAHLNTYHNSAIGWTITIPDGFSMLSKNRIQANEAKGRAAIGVDSAQTNGLQHLVNFQKNQFNLFNATLQKVAAADLRNFQKNQQLVKRAIFDAYAKQKIEIDSASSKTALGGYTFDVFAIKIFGPDHTLLMNQTLYSALINGFDFSVNINYNNETDHEQLLSAFRNSIFVQPKN